MTFGETLTNKRNRHSIKTPGAAVVIFNYKHRLGTPGITEDQAHEIDQLILNTVSLKSVNTSKSKSQAAGRFEIKLAPTKNWVNSITPGSWCVILMSQSKITHQDTKYQKPTAKQNKVKMLGRIESVRMVSTVDQLSGAITTEYVAVGEDWGGILNTALYVDPLIRGKAEEKDPIAAAERIIYNKKLVGFGSKDSPLPSSSENIQTLLGFWGKTTETRNEIKSKYLDQGRIAESNNQFRLPQEVSDFFKFKAKNLSDIISIINGRLKSKDNGSDFTKYYEPVDDGAAPILLDTLIGINSFWQLIMNNSNHWINDTYNDFRWEDGEVKLAIYNRIKPFALNNVSELVKRAQSESRPNQNQSVELKELSSLVSPFKNIRAHKIDKTDLILVNAGTNWRDRYNFIEVNIKSGMLAGAPGNENYSAETKLRNQTFDSVSIGRDGFKPMIINAKYIPKNPKNNELDPFRVLEYKAMNREWFFNIHRTLNGSLTLVGQEDYIAVGDNIIIEADAIFPNNNGNEDQIANPNNSYFLAHVESISHNASVSETGSRTFITDIQFVRGIIVDKNGNQLDKDVHVDENTHNVTPVQELNSDSTFGTSSGKDGAADPDIQKLKGK